MPQATYLRAISERYKSYVIIFYNAVRFGGINHEYVGPQQNLRFLFVTFIVVCSYRIPHTNKIS